jgi:nicotinic acid mononucleotide adenylyltransferase
MAGATRRLPSTAALPQALGVDATRSGEGDDRPRLEPLDEEPTGDRPIALLAGSFDPPTVAHVALALAWRAETPGDVVLVYADRTLPKEPGTEAPLLGDATRLEALRRLTAANEGLHAARSSHGLLVDQAEAAHGRWPAAPLTVLLGSDKARQLFDPAWYDDRDEALGRLFAVAVVRYAERAGDTGLIAATLARPENAPFRSRIGPIEVPISVAAVASSAVRRRIRSGQSVADLVPPEVLPLVTV